MTESTDSNRSDQQRDRQNSGKERDVESSVHRLEKAVQELVSVAKEEFSDRAGAFVEETTERLRAELGSERSSRHSSKHASRRARRKAKYARRAARSAERSSHVGRGGRILVRDSKNEKICGVCAGLANYWEMEAWVVRCIAVTGLIFMPQIVLPAYFIACLVMGKDKSAKQKKAGKDLGTDNSTLAPEFGPLLSPRNSLRNIQAELAQSELRLRRMETHVTSGHYELQRELNKIDNEQV